MVNDTIAYLREDVVDNIFTWVSLGLGLPGNILIFLAFLSYPAGAYKLMYQLLAVFDAVSLVLLVSQRPLVWYGLMTLENREAEIALKIFINVTYYTSIFTNMVSVFLALERLLYARYPNSHVQYYESIDRVKLTLLILGLLIMSFCLIITIKMSYFGLAWIVVFLTFYTIFPSCAILACIVLLISHYVTKYKERKYLEQNKPLTASRTSFAAAEKGSFSHHSALSAAGAMKGSNSSSQGFKGRKKDPYSLYPVEKSASESHLAVKCEHSSSNGGTQRPTGTMSKSKSGQCINTVVSLKVPSLYSLAIHRTVDKEDFLTQEQEEQLLRKKIRNRQLTLMGMISSAFITLSIVPLTACAVLLTTDDRKGLDMTDRYTYLMLSVTTLVMYVIHASKFYTYCVVSSIFRRHVLAVFTCSQKNLALEETPITPQ